MVHPLPSLATTAAAVAFGLAMRVPPARLVFVAFTILMTQFSISALNEWADRDRDAAAHRWRPVALHRLAPSVALVLAIVFALGAVPAMFAFGLTAAIVLVMGLAAGWAYDLWLKPTPLSFLPFAIAFPLLPTWVGLVDGRSLVSFSRLIVAGAILAIAIHLADSLPDIDVDASAGVRSLAVALGAERAVRAIIVGLLLASVVMLAALATRPVVAVLVGVAALITASLVARTRSRPQQARWIVGAFAIVAAVALVARLPR